MAEKAIPWTGNGTGDGTSGGYTALEWSEMWRRLFLGGQETTAGVLRGVGSELAVAGVTSPLSVGTGSAVAYGKVYTNDTALTLTVATPTVGTTGGHVILRLDWAAQTVRAVAVRNTDGLSAIPSLTQSTSTQWEIRLATFTIATNGAITLTDARQYLHMATKVSQAMLDTDSVGTPQLLDNAVTTTKILNDAVDNTKVGLRVPQFVRRRGGDATQWATVGSDVVGNDRTPGMVIAQGGSITIAAGGGASGMVTVNFPQAFSATPLVLLTPMTPGVYLSASVVYTNRVQIEWTFPGANLATLLVMWLAIGPE